MRLIFLAILFIPQVSFASTSLEQFVNSLKKSGCSASVRVQHNQVHEGDTIEDVYQLILNSDGPRHDGYISVDANKSRGLKALKNGLAPCKKGWRIFSTIKRYVKENKFKYVISWVQEDRQLYSNRVIIFFEGTRKYITLFLGTTFHQ